MEGNPQPETKSVSQVPQQSPVVPQAPPKPTMPTKLKKWLKTKVLIILIILVGLGVGGFFVWKNFFVPKEVYKGVWMPTLGVSSILGEKYQQFEPVFSDLNKAAEAGIDTLAFQIGYFVNEQGELSMVPGEKDFFASFIDEAHARGFKIWLNPEIIRQSVLDRGGSSTRTMPEEMIENTDLIKNFEAGIIEIAKFAEEHNVEIFSPSSEMYVNLDFDKPGRERSKRLIVDIKPKIDAVYSGKICLRGEWPKPEFSAYSCFGPTIGMPESEQEKNDLINQIENAREQTTELMLGEIWEGNDWEGTEEDFKRGHAMALEAGKGRVSGFFILDVPRPFIDPENFESMVKEFYTKQ